jgi:hypothetical protein
MYNDNSMIVMAIHIALNAHGMQLDKGGMPYILHPLHVMDCVNGSDAKIVAVLHDTVEDTEQTLDGLRTAGFSEEIVGAVDAITKRKGEKKRDYWARVKANKLALYVKLWDMAHNSSEGRLAALPKDEQDYLRRKYGEAREFFAEKDGLMPVIDGWNFGDARTMLTAVGYKEDYWCDGWRLIMDANERGVVKIGLDNTIRLVE